MNCIDEQNSSFAIVGLLSMVAIAQEVGLQLYSLRNQFKTNVRTT